MADWNQKDVFDLMREAEYRDFDAGEFKKEIGVIVEDLWDFEK